MFYKLKGQDRRKISVMKSFSFVHAADLHLGYAQYNLDVRRKDLTTFLGN